MVQIGSSAPRLSRVPKIRFRKGIQRTNEDSEIGFVSDLKNMEIIEGTLKRRKGSKLLNDNTQNRRWYFLEEVEISGCNLLVGLDYKRNFYAFHPYWPETEFKLLYKGIEKRFHSDTTRDFHISFRRGSNFFMYSNERYAFVTNDFGDTLRFDKRGYICFSKEVDEAHEKRIPGDIDSLRTSSPSNPGIWVDVVDASNKEMQEFYLFEDDARYVRPIAGPVRLAWKNEAGVISKFSEPLNLSRYKKVCASLFAGQSIYDNVMRDCGFENMVYEAISTGDYDYYYIAKTGTVTAADYYANTLAPDRRLTTFDTYKFHLYYVGYDWTGGATITADQYFLALPQSAGHTLNQSSTFSTFIRIKNIRGWGGAGTDSRRVSYGEIDTEVINVDSASNVVKLPYSLLSTADGTTRTYPTTSNSTTNFILRLRDLELDDATYFRSQNVQISAAAASNQFSFNGTIFECDVDKNSEGFPTHYMACKENIAWRSIRSFKSAKFDCWENDYDVTGFLTFGAIEGQVEINPVTKTFTVVDSSFLYNKDIVIDNSYQQISKFWESGSRFVVWNEDKIISENQRCWADANNNYLIRYEESQRTSITTVWSGELSFNSPNDKNTTAVTDWRVVYQPFSRLEFQGMRSYPYEAPAFQEVIKNPRYIVLNNNKLFVIQEGNLWLGNETLMLNKVVQLGYTVYNMIEFFDGVLISGSKGLFYFNRTLDERFVKNEKIKTMVTGATGAFYVDFNDHVWRVDLVFGQTDVPFVRTTKISEHIKEVTWGSEPVMYYADETLWIKTDREIWGYRDGGWTRKYNFDNRKIKSISSYKDQLVVIFEKNVDKRVIFDQPTDTVDWYFDDGGGGGWM